MRIAEWAEQGRLLGVLGRASGWWIGDWIRYGKAHYGDKYTAAVRLTGYDVQSLMNMAYVAGRFDVSRRREGLSFSHHAELAGLAQDDQDLWLDRAEAGRLSVRGLRLALREARRRVAARGVASEARRAAGHPAARRRLRTAAEHVGEPELPRGRTAGEGRLHESPAPQADGSPPAAPATFSGPELVCPECGQPIPVGEAETRERTPRGSGALPSS